MTPPKSPPRSSSPRKKPSAKTSKPPSGQESEPPKSDTSSTSKPNDFLHFQNRYQELLDRLRPALTNALGQHAAEMDWDPFDFHTSLYKFWEQALHRPQNLMDLQVEYWRNMSLLFTETSKKLRGEDSQIIIDSDKSDRRFRDPIWNENPLFNFLKQSYLITGDIVQKSIQATTGMDKQEQSKLHFMARQFMDSVSPTNFPFYNPEVIRETLNTRGENLLRGLENLIEDLERGHGRLDIAKTNYETYAVGKNLAITAGDVVFRNDLIELIQYKATTEQVCKTPVLIVPPWINKYYILDMRADNSFVKWATDQGHSVFMISWVNPDASLGEKDFSDYMEDGIFAALDAIEHQTHEKSVHAVGYCIGGTLLATTLAYMTANKLCDRISSATFLTTLIDFANSGDLKLFTDAAQIERIEKRMMAKGYLDGRELRNTFSMLRANDLIWSFVVNNYLLGREPFPFDLLYWNDDSTNMPARMHSFYLKNMYRDNLLCKAGGIKIKSTPIDVRKIDIPTYFLSTKDDHIAPWLATYDGMHLLSGKKTFVLSASGHIAGVVNPPAANKYHYWTSDKPINDHDYAEEWLAHAQQHHGSWWSHWSAWIKTLSPAKVPARAAKYSLCPAPGTYVLKRV